MLNIILRTKFVVIKFKCNETRITWCSGRIEQSKIYKCLTEKELANMLFIISNLLRS